MLPSIVAPAQISANSTLASQTPPGAFAEVGVYQGGHAWFLYKVALMQNRALHLFDTFTGTPNCVEGLDKHKIGDEFAAPMAERHIRELMPMAQLHVGVYPDTHPADLPPLAFVHCDCDQYQSYKAVIAHMWPLVVFGGILLFDDYPYLAGAKQAVEEHFTPDMLRRCLDRNYVVKSGE